MKRIDTDTAMMIFCGAIIVLITQAVGFIAFLSGDTGFGGGMLMGLVLIPALFIVVYATHATLDQLERFFTRKL